MTDPTIRRAGNRVFLAGIALLVIWVLGPIWLLFVNALSAPVDPAALKPAAIAQRARALLRAGTSARRYHDALANRI